MNEELKQIKKTYGEEMMHLCRDLFPTILETPGLLLSILENNLAHTKSFATDVKEYEYQDAFKNWIYSKVKYKKKGSTNTNKTPFELMNEAGYKLYECKTEEDIQKFKRYYSQGEELCTFRGGRLERCHVFFAVKKNVDEIKRENFTNPKREDEYGTSVISIQFSRGENNFLSIKNRYNHTVNNPDATFANNLENIIPGLSKSFERTYDLNISQEKSNEAYFLSTMNYLIGPDGKYYRKNLEKDGCNYCENNIIITDTLVKKFAKHPERYIIMDQYCLDLQKKTIESLADFDDSFEKSINEVGEIQRITVTKDGDNKIITIYYEDDKKVFIKIDKHNSIIGYDNKYVKNISSSFLEDNENVTNISLPNAETIENDFMANNAKIKTISLPNVRRIGNYFLGHATKIENISLPEVLEIHDAFLKLNRKLTSLSLPKVKEIGYAFLVYNIKLNEISLPEVEIIGDHFLDENENLERISLPQVRKIGRDFLENNEELKEISLPQIEEIGSGFLNNNTKLKRYITNFIEEKKKNSTLSK